MPRIAPLSGLSYALLIVIAVGCGRSTAPQQGPGTEDGGSVSLDGGGDAGESSSDGGESGTASCDGLTLGPGQYSWSVVHEGMARTFEVRVPQSYQPQTPTPLVLNFHGYGSNKEEQEYTSQMTPVSDEAGFIVVYPNGVNAQELGKPFAENNRSWNVGPDCCGVANYYGVDDVGFVRSILAELGSKLCVDERRIFSTGMSNGGFFSHRLGCELSDRIAAIAPVAGVNGMEPCTPSRPVPVLQIHGTDDVVVPYGGNSSFESAPETVARWAERNGCSTTTVETFRNGDTDCQTYQDCAADVETTLCTTDGGGHTWPSGKFPPSLGYTTTDYDASREMWKFFEAHPLPIE